MVLDYDQLLDKTPGAADAVFPWHQDMAYWPNTTMTPDTRTVTFSLALDSTSKENGCIRYISKSGKTKTLRPHLPIGKNKNDAHAIAIKIDPNEVREFQLYDSIAINNIHIRVCFCLFSSLHAMMQLVEYAEVPRGSVSLHDEYIVHGSGGNISKRQRRTYVIAYRTKETVEIERKAGFTHSHNDHTNWDVFNDWKH